MFWNDIEKIRDCMNRLTDRLVRIDDNVQKIGALIKQETATSSVEARLDGISELIANSFCPEEEHAPMNRIHDKLDQLIRDADRQQASILAQETLDKFDDYMKNIDKLNALINEFKGCVSVARGALEDRKQLAEQEAKTAVLADMTKEIYKSMRAFIRAGDNLEYKAYYKLDAIYRSVCLDEDKKQVKKARKKAKNTAVSEVVVSE